MDSHGRTGRAGPPELVTLGHEKIAVQSLIIPCIPELQNPLASNGKGNCSGMLQYVRTASVSLGSSPAADSTLTPLGR